MQLIVEGRSGWSATVNQTHTTFLIDGERVEFCGLEAVDVDVRPRLFRSSVHLPDHTLTGLSRRSARRLLAANTRVVARGRLARALEQAADCRERLHRLLLQHDAEQRWIPHDVVQAIINDLPQLPELTPGLVEHLAPQDHEALNFVAEDHWSLVAQANQRIAADEKVAHADLFSSIESSPLTDEQIDAVVTFDNRVSVVAAAGSGKTSVMVARSAYAVARGFVAPDRILLLAFNTKAAEELKSRVTSRLSAAGLDHEGITASTFHALGLDLIGKATGSKPRVAPWVDGGQAAHKIMSIAEDLRRESPTFRFHWFLFKMVFGRTPPAKDANQEMGPEPFRTLGGDVVRSEGERIIADWLYMNGVAYQYERPYQHDVSTAEKSQYCPDFYYPKANLWHEHWGVDRHGNAPESFADYAEGMRWKRELHAKNGTTLIETTWHDVVQERDLTALEQQLTEHGIELDWDPERPITGEPPLNDKELANLILTFMKHVKSNRLSPDDVDARLREQSHGMRGSLFTSIFWPILDRWQADLRAENLVDFEDMLAEAARVLEDDPELAQFDLVLVDEFQDTSRARAQLVRALTTRPDSYLLTVGDDWQAINRFAGADLSVMTDFESVFGPFQELRLQTTFRCSQAIADVSSRFVSRNPNQITKQVRAVRQNPADTVRVVSVGSTGAVTDAISTVLKDIARAHPGATVDVLGRYGFDEDLVPSQTPRGLTVTFRTVHSSKGLEADHVIVPNVSKGKYGFPSRIGNDPLLALAMSAGDEFPDAEERRLMYVALTRAKTSVTLIAVAGRESAFLTELVEDPDVSGTSAPLRKQAMPCPSCTTGELVIRTGPYGRFYGCTQYPTCGHTRQIR